MPGEFQAVWRALAGRGFAFGQFFAFLHCFNNHGIEFQQCMGPSMLPTFNVIGDVLVLEHFSVDFEKIKVGDVVMSRSPLNPRMTVCKRVLGMEGDVVNVDASRSLLVPKGHVWLQGDNTGRSRDSRDYGPVPYAMLQGKVFYRIWPPQGWGPIGSTIPEINQVNVKPPV